MPVTTWADTAADACACAARLMPLDSDAVALAELVVAETSWTPLLSCADAVLDACACDTSITPVASTADALALAAAVAASDAPGDASDAVAELCADAFAAMAMPLATAADAALEA